MSCTPSYTSVHPGSTIDSAVSRAIKLPDVTSPDPDERTVIVVDSSGNLVLKKFNTNFSGFEPDPPTSTDFDQVILTFPDTLTAGTAVNVQTGVYSGGGPASLEGDTITLPATGAEFESDAAIQIYYNGQELNKGSGLGDDEAQWVSTTQIAFYVDVFAGSQIKVRVRA